MNNYILKLKNEADNWENASPLGCGCLGAMVYGNVISERISLNEESIWAGGPKNTYVSDYKNKLLHIRSLFMEGKPYEAEMWAQENFNNCFFEIDSYEAAGEIFIDAHDSSEYSNYKRDLDLNRGILNISYNIGEKSYQREYFTSHPAKLFCSKIQCDPLSDISVRFERKNIIKQQFDYELSKGTACMHYICKTAIGENQFKVSIKIETDGMLKLDNGALQISKASDIILYTSVVTDYKDPSLNTDKFLKLSESGYENIKKAHMADFSALMGRSDIAFEPVDNDLNNLSASERLERLCSNNSLSDNGLISLYFQFGKYLLVSSSREDTLPANLQGLWSDGLESPWNSDYHTNINLQMNYWPAETANIPECTDALFNYMNNCLLHGGRRVAKENYDSQGAVVHHVSDIYGFAAAADGMWGLWPLGGAWLAYHMWEHYMFTSDKEFLKNTAYEFIRDCAVFFMETMFERPDGTILSGPSTSPENNYLIDVEGEKKPVSLAISPTMDIQIIGGLLDFYAETEDILHICPQGAEKARKIRAKMPKMKIGKFGQLQEWLEDYEEYEPGHKHISHAFGLFPSAQITRATPELYNAIKVTLERRLSFGGGHTGWSRAWLINLFARLKDGESAYNNLHALLTKSTLPNLFDNHPPFQIDGNFGGAAAIAEMVLQSHEGFISLLPAISAEMKNGTFENLCARGNYVLSAKWENCMITDIEISSNQSKYAVIELPQGQINCMFTDGKNTYASVGRELRIPCPAHVTSI